MAVVMHGDAPLASDGAPVPVDPVPDPASTAPLAVAGTVHGRPVEALVTGLPDVLATIADWTADDPDAIGCWGLRGDYSELLIVPVRLRPGTVSESERAVHLVCLLPGEAHGRTLRALCGRALSLVGVVTVAVGEGMPCEPCLARRMVLDATRHIGIQNARDHHGSQRAITGRLDRQIG